jgi:hypothetical protein
MTTDYVVHIGSASKIATSTKILPPGSFIFAQDTKKLKIANGVLSIKDLSYLAWSSITQIDIDRWNSGTGGGGVGVESDPIFALSPASGILAGDITNWNNAFSWGDHALAGYLTAFVEADPIFTASAAGGIVALDITNWNDAFSWGDHALAGYLTSFTELDPVFSASPAAGILAGDITNWNTAFGWGNHASAGYLTVAAANLLYPQLAGTYNNPSWINQLAWAKITGTPTTLGGYGITDAVPNTRTITVHGSSYQLSTDQTININKTLTFITYNSDGVTPLTTGVKNKTAIIIDKACTGIKWFLLADQVANVTVDVWRKVNDYPISNAETIVLGTLPNLAGNIYNESVQDFDSLAVGDVVLIEVTANDVATYLELRIECIS